MSASGLIPRFLVWYRAAPHDCRNLLKLSQFAVGEGSRSPIQILSEIFLSILGNLRGLFDHYNILTSTEILSKL